MVKEAKPDLTPQELEAYNLARRICADLEEVSDPTTAYAVACTIVDEVARRCYPKGPSQAIGALTLGLCGGDVTMALRVLQASALAIIAGTAVTPPTEH